VTWFKVDDSLHSHNKIRKVLADEPAALALWLVAGSWSSANLTDGLVPDHQLPWLFPTDPESLARKLVTARLWRRVRGGYKFHDWTDWNPTAEHVQAVRKARAEAGRKGGSTRKKPSSKGRANASANASANGQQISTPSRPLPPSEEGRDAAARDAGEADGVPQPQHWSTLPAYGQLDPRQALRNSVGRAKALAEINGRKPEIEEEAS
jgi:hypothetical protein